MAVSEKVIMEAKRHLNLNKEWHQEYLEEWLKNNKDLKPKIDRLEKFLKSTYKEEVREFISYLYNGSHSPVYSLCDEIRSKQYSYDYHMSSYNSGCVSEKPAYQDLGSYLRDKVNEHYEKVFHDVEKVELSEDDLKYLQNSISKYAYECLIESVENYNSKKKTDFDNTTDIILCHTWDVNHSNGRYDTLIYGSDIDKIEEVLKKHGFRRREYEVDRKCVKDTFTTNY